MNSEYQNRLEREIDRHLKALPELQAPPTLAVRVRRCIEAQNRAAWYERPWPSWPFSVKAASLVILLTLFAGVCVGTWFAPRTSAFSNALSQITAFMGSITLVRDTVNLLGSALLLVVRQLSTSVLIGCAAAAALAYFICMGLGTVCVRLAFSRR